MKKHLIAAAVAGALAVPAMAQVTISGRIDTSITTTSKNSQGSSQTTIASGIISTNQLVFKGSEDLGGGLKADFTIASQINTDESRTFVFGDRGALVGLSGGFGSIHLGKDTGNTMNSISGGMNGNLSDIAGRRNRTDNSIIYSTPSLAGLKAKVIHSVGKETATDDEAGQFTELGLAYKAGPITAQLAYATHEGGTSAADDTETGVAVTYDFGMGKVNFRYIDFDQDGSDSSDYKRSGLGVQFPIAKGMKVTVDYFKHDQDGSTKDYAATNASFIYDLSKRTNVYLAYVAVDNESGASYRGNGSSGPKLATKAGEDPNVVSIGVRHKF
jgi:predicted porin